jgi:hypothetical protein
MDHLFFYSETPKKGWTQFTNLFNSYYTSNFTDLLLILWKLVTSYILVDEKHEKNGTMSLKMFTLAVSNFRNNVAKLRLHSLHHSGEINNNMLKL